MVGQHGARSGRGGGRAALAAVSAVLIAASAWPCAPAPRPGDHVAIVGEEALIVWDPAGRRQHFVRRAKFQTDAADFGFLVPTPSRPELAEAPAEVFDRLTSAIEPRVLEQARYEICPSLLMCVVFMSRSRPDRVDAVRVLETTRVAGYDATVLAADDAAALERWLAEHGYAHGPALREWLAPYVHERWIVTAFKVAGGSKEPIGSSAVRMSFATDRPLFPYREPADQRADERPPRSLRVFLVAPGRMEGKLASGMGWPGRLEYASPDVDVVRLLDGVIPAADIPREAWLTAFHDPSNPRPGDADLVFAPAADAIPVTPPPVRRDVSTVLPLPIFEGVVLGGLGLWISRRSKRKAEVRSRD